MSYKYVCLLFLILFISCEKQEYNIMEEVENLHNQGLFNRADSLIETYLANNPDLDDKNRRALNFEIERGKRIINDYLLTEERLISLLDTRMEDFNLSEFQMWQAEGRFDMLMINGEKRYANPSASNLFFRYPELRSRKRNKNTRSSTARLTFALAEKLKKLSIEQPDPIRLPRKCKVVQKLRIAPGIIPANETVSCWLPYPTIFQTQGPVRYLGASSKPIWIDHASSAIRSVYLEEKMPHADVLEFSVSYEYTAYAYYNEIDTNAIQKFSGDEPQFKIYTAEDPPHKIFTPGLRQLASNIVDQEENPYLKAKRIYEWIADSIKYSYAREYSTLRNISEYCLNNRYGDCGQEAILFITLCRISGVPARWQSGFFTFPGDEGMHDWSEIFVKPYGWIPVDTYMGIFFTSMTADLSAEQRSEMRNFYFGNLDHYRLVANKGHNQPLFPPKKHVRSETVDFQRGEVEWQGGNLYFPDWRWDLKVTQIL